MTSDEWVHTSAAQQIRFGAGAAADVGRVVRDLGGRRILLITTSGRLDSADGRGLVQTLGSALVSTYAGARAHVPTSAVEEALRQSRRDGVDTVVSFGGGSCADLGKAVCYLHRAGAGHAGVVAPRPARVAARLGAHDLFRRGADPVLRDDR